jgi:hypothetical protein
MDIRALLIGEIQRQTNFTLIAFEELKKSVENTDSWGSQKSVSFFSPSFYPLYSVLHYQVQEYLDD